MQAWNRNIGYGADRGTACNVTYDQIGNIVAQPTRTGVRQLSYLADGSVRRVIDGSTAAHFRYDAFGEVQELDLTSSTSPDTRHDRRYGGLIAWRDEAAGASTTSVLTRTIPGPDGFVATRHGAGGPWVFAFGEARGNRFFTDETGGFVQDVDYLPFGEATSSGAQPGSSLYSHDQWNGGDALAALGALAARRAALRSGHRPVPESRPAADPAHRGHDQPVRVRDERSGEPLRPERVGLHRRRVQP